MLKTRCRILDRFGPSGEVIPYVLFVAVLFLCSDEMMIDDRGSDLRLRSRIARGVGCLLGSRVTLKVSWSATGRSPSRLQLCLLYTRKVGLYPYTNRSFRKSCAASSPDLARLELVDLAHPLSE